MAKPGVRPRFLKGQLWRHPDFLRLWAGQSLSQLGTQVTQLALPTAAIKLLGAGPAQVGMLAALQFLAFPVLGLFAGVLVDRIRRRPVLVVCDLARLLLLASVPGAYFVGALNLAQLYVVALLVGVSTVFFDVAYQSYLPSLIGRDQLVEGNSKLEVGQSIALVAGPTVAGSLIQAFRAAPAILADALSYALSVLSLLSIRTPEPDPVPSAGTTTSGFLSEMREGLDVVFGNPLIRLIAGCTATWNLGASMFLAVLLLYGYNQLHLSPGEFGLVYSIGSVGALVGAALAFPVAKRLGVGATLAVSMALSSGILFLVPAASADIAFPVLGFAFFVSFLGSPIYNVNQVSLRQALIPVRLQGRANATVRTVIWGTLPLGSAIGGVLGSHIGLAQTILVAVTISTLSVIWILAGPVVRLRTIPETVGT